LALILPIAAGVSVNKLSDETLEKIGDSVDNILGKTKASAATETWKCSKCGATFPAGTAFCNQCGTKLEPAKKSFCPKCGAAVTDDTKFCTCCGAPVNQPPQQDSIINDQDFRK